MKYALAILALSVMWIGCSKSANDPDSNIPSYVGTYNSTSGDTVYVSMNGNFTKIQWSPNGSPKIIFDSVMVASDLSFTDNESVSRVMAWSPYPTFYYHSVGTGNFGTNTISFNFDINGHVIFAGIKKP